MTKVVQIKHEVCRLSELELASFRAWFSEFDVANWDRQFEVDASAERLDVLAGVAIALGSAPPSPTFAARYDPRGPSHAGPARRRGAPETLRAARP